MVQVVSTSLTSYLSDIDSSHGINSPVFPFFIHRTFKRWKEKNHNLTPLPLHGNTLPPLPPLALGHAPFRHFLHGITWNIGWFAIYGCALCAVDPERDVEYIENDADLPLSPSLTLVPNTTIAYVGDTGHDEQGWGDVAALIGSRNASAVVLLGDFSYPERKEVRFL